jgi:hypothetical protein
MNDAAFLCWRKKLAPRFFIREIGQTHFALKPHTATQAETCHGYEWGDSLYLLILVVLSINSKFSAVWLNKRHGRVS